MKSDQFVFTMKIELIPIIEITNYDQDIATPVSGPYWKFPDDWEAYRIATNSKAEYSDQLRPYVKGSSFYKISEINDEDLLKIIHKEIAIQQTEENLGIDDLVSPFCGGYILKIDDVDKYLPQCCGNLGDIKDWINLLEDEDPYFYMGHPSPRIKKTANKIIFDFLNSEIQDPYVPPMLEDQLEVDENALKIAIRDTKKQLDTFAKKLICINNHENLNIPDIDKILIYGIDN